jgi:hypothetical protein
MTFARLYNLVLIALIITISMNINTALVQTNNILKFKRKINLISKQALKMDISTNEPVVIQPINSNKHKLLKRWITGLTLGAVGTGWIFSGNGYFTSGFLLASLVAQNEYYAMVKAAGLRQGLAPASKTGTMATLVCYIAGTDSAM